MANVGGGRCVVVLVPAWKACVSSLASLVFSRRCVEEGIGRFVMPPDVRRVALWSKEEGAMRRRSSIG